MKTVVMILGLLILGIMAYYGYSYGVEKSAEMDRARSSDNRRMNEKIKAIETEVSIEEQDEDIAVKSSLDEDIPTEVEEIRAEEDIIENEKEVIEEATDEITEEDKIIDEQEALMEQAAKEQLEHEPYISPEEAAQKAEKEKAGVPILESEEDRIIREEEKRNQVAMAEDNVSE
jgi:hypothetical protein